MPNHNCRQNQTKSSLSHDPWVIQWWCRTLGNEFAVSEPTCSAALLAVAEGRWPDRPQTEALGSLLARCIACLIRVPQLLTVVAELCVAALPAAGDLRTAGTAEGDDCVPGEGEMEQINDGDQTIANEFGLYAIKHTGNKENPINATHKYLKHV